MNAPTSLITNRVMTKKFKLAALASLLSIVVLINGCGQAGATKTEGEIAEDEDSHSC